MELTNILEFVPKNKDSINNVSKIVSVTIKSLNINTSGQLTIAKLLKINGEINKAIKSQKELFEALSKINDGEKTGVIVAVIIEIINSEDFKSILSEEQRKQVEDFCKDTETAETVVGLIDWIADTTLESMDTNKDGIVTEDEIEDNFVGCCLCVDRCGQNEKGCGCYQPTGCCKCCPGFVSSCAGCFSGFFLKFLCCKKNKQVEYKEPVQQSETVESTTGESKTEDVVVNVN